MIDALIVGRFQATARTKPRLVIKRFGFWLNTCNQKHICDTCGNGLSRFMKDTNMLRTAILFSHISAHKLNWKTIKSIAIDIFLDSF